MLKRVFFLILAIVYLSAVLPGCSVALAARGSDDPDLSKVVPGSTKQEIDEALGEPLEEKPMGGQTVSLYTYKVGDEASYGRAALHLLLDMFTLCLWEYVAWPLEISKSGDVYDVNVHYDAHNVALQVEQEKAPKKDDAQQQAGS